MAGTNLLFSTAHHGYSIATLHTLCDRQGPTVLIVKVGDHVFGVSAPHPMAGSRLVVLLYIVSADLNWSDLL